VQRYEEKNHHRGKNGEEFFFNLLDQFVHRVPFSLLRFHQENPVGARQIADELGFACSNPCLIGSLRDDV
jgi:hypothetical protein